MQNTQKKTDGQDKGKGEIVINYMGWKCRHQFRKTSTLTSLGAVASGGAVTAGFEGISTCNAWLSKGSMLWADDMPGSEYSIYSPCGEIIGQSAQQEGGKIGFSDTLLSLDLWRISQ